MGCAFTELKNMIQENFCLVFSSKKKTIIHRRRSKYNAVLNALTSLKEKYQSSYQVFTVELRRGCEYYTIRVKILQCVT